MSDLSRDVRAATEQILDRIGVDGETPAVGGDLAIWNALRDSGFTDMHDGDDDATDGGWAALLTVVATTASTGAVTPFIEHAVLARWLASRARLELSTTTTIAIADDQHGGVTLSDSATTLSGTVTDVVLTGAEMIVVAVPHGDDQTTAVVIDLRAPGVVIHDGTDLVGAPYGDIDFDAAPVHQIGRADLSIAELRERGAIAYAAALAAAATRVRDATVTYAGERTQFGRPLTKFQAIQQRLAQLAATTTLMETAASTAAREYGTGSRAADTRIAAAAKTVTSACAREVAAAGHQIHGAIGFTSEHSLGRATTSLWSWRDRFGTETQWAQTLAAHIVDDGADVWDVIVGATPPPAQKGPAA